MLELGTLNFIIKYYFTLIEKEDYYLKIIESLLSHKASVAQPSSLYILAQVVLIGFGIWKILILLL